MNCLRCGIYRRMAYKLGLKFTDDKMELSYRTFRIEMESKLMNVTNIVSIILNGLYLLLGIIGSSTAISYRIAFFVFSILGAFVKIKFPKLSKAILLGTSLSNCYLIMAMLKLLISKCQPETYYLIGNAFAFAEVILTLSLKSLSLKIIFTISSFVIKLVVLSHGLTYNVIIRIFGNTIVFLFFYLYAETMERRNYRMIYESREKLKKFQSLLSNDFPIGVVILSSDFNSVLYSNHFFRSMLGSNTNQSQVLSVFKKFFIKTCSSFLNLDLPSDCTLKEFFYIFLPKAAILAEKEVITVSAFFCDTPYKLNESSPCYEIKLQKIDWDSKPSYALIFHDVSDRQLVSALKLADEQKDRVIATVSHELRTPINGILGMLEIVASKTADRASQKYLEYCKSCSKLLLYLVNSILDLSQIRHNKLKIVKNYFKLEEVFDEVRSLYAFQADEKKINFIINSQKGLPALIYSDKYRLIEILINLLGNAFKFTSKGSISLTVYQDILSKTKMCFSVTDTGVGIKEEDKPKLFQVFGKLKQEDKNLNAHGAGLGLTIANELVGVLNDSSADEKIRFDSEFGKGTTFYFNLSIGDSSSSGSISSGLEDEDKETLNDQPNDELKYDSEISLQKWDIARSPSLHSKKLLSASNKKTLSRPMSLNINNSEIYLKRKRILVVDDNPFNILAVTFLLEKLNFKVAKAMSGEDCLQVLSDSMNDDQLFDLVLMDIQMPIMDGLETTKIINIRIKDGLLYNVPIVALSANENNDKDVAAYKECGMVDYLHKPLRENELDRILTKWIAVDK